MGRGSTGTTIVAAVFTTVMFVSASGATATEVGNITWPVKRVAKIDGDITLGGLFIVHKRSEKFTCGRVRQNGLQALEMMLYTIDKVNNDSTLLPGIRLGAHIVDSCDSDAHALEESIDFIRGANTMGSEGHCQCSDGSVSDQVSIAGVVGASSSVVSVQIANLLRLFRIPQVSYWSTSPELSNKERFEYFSRTVPSDIHQARAIVDLIQFFNWTYISVVYEDSNYGSNGFAEVEEEARKRSICIASSEKIPRDKKLAIDEDFDKIITNLRRKSNAKAVVVFALEQDVTPLMQAAHRAGVAGEFVWIGSDGWSGNKDVVRGRETTVEGAIAFSPLFSNVDEFDEYFVQQTPEVEGKRNPWFSEYWEEVFRCKLPDSYVTPFNKELEPCKGNESLRTPGVYEQTSPKMQFVADGVLAFAHALTSVQAKICGKDFVGLCASMSKMSGADLLGYLRKVSFRGINGDHFEFQANGDGPARYKVFNFQRNDEGEFVWTEVGTYVENQLHLQFNKVRFTASQPVHHASICSKPCEPGYAMILQEGDSCCWVCTECTKYQYLRDEFTCHDCPIGTLPDHSRTRCVTSAEEYVTYDSPWGIGLLCFATTGIVITAMVIIIYVRHNETPIVKASGRELSYVLLVGILLSYVISFIVVARPTIAICAITKVGIGFCFTMCYAALLTKTNRIARIFDRAKTSVKNTKYISPASQLVICSCIVCVQFVILGAWLALQPPRTTYHHPIREKNELTCAGATDATYLVGLVYPFFLMVFCTVYAFKTRNCPEGFNEAKYIGFTMYTTCVIWLSFVPIYFVSSQNIALRVTTLSVSVGLSATVTLFCIFAPKLYIILLRPEQNTRSCVMGSDGGTSVGIQTRRTFSEVVRHTIQTERLKTRSQCNSVMFESSSGNYSNISLSLEHNQNANKTPDKDIKIESYADAATEPLTSSTAV
ncbi:metabotropic glutamate receptor 3-like [Ptychodera flava]|uniref:metabotropic glutamate receptor 3-like n=1 Tax=Ptychodera flava TaxID=63121 RepID=UPI00396A930B